MTKKIDPVLRERAARPVREHWAQYPPTRGRCLNCGPSWGRGPSHTDGAKCAARAAQKEEFPHRKFTFLPSARFRALTTGSLYEYCKLNLTIASERISQTNTPRGDAHVSANSQGQERRARCVGQGQ